MKKLIDKYVEIVGTLRRESISLEDEVNDLYQIFDELFTALRVINRQETFKENLQRFSRTLSLQDVKVLELAPDTFEIRCGKGLTLDTKTYCFNDFKFNVMFSIDYDGLPYFVEKMLKSWAKWASEMKGYMQ